MVQYLFYIANHAIEHPLDVHFEFPSQRKLVQALVRPNIGKDRLRDPDTLRVDLAPLGGVNLGRRPPEGIGELNPNVHRQMPSFVTLGYQALELRRT
jgi:hypothetical protein